MVLCTTPCKIQRQQLAGMYCLIGCVKKEEVAWETNEILVVVTSVNAMCQNLVMFRSPVDRSLDPRSIRNLTYVFTTYRCTSYASRPTRTGVIVW